MDIMTIITNFIDRLLTWAKAHLNPNFLISNENYFADKIASPATALSLALILLGGLIGAIKADMFMIFLGGIGAAIAVILCYYIGKKFINDCANAITNNPTTISSSNFLDVTALIAILVFVAIGIGGIYFAIKVSNLNMILGTAALLIAVAYFICIMLNPDMISTTVDPQSTATHDALTILAIYNKIAVRLSKIAFGSSALIGMIALIIGIIDLLRYDAGRLMYGGLEMGTGIYFLTFGLLSPFLTYMIFIFLYIFIEVLMALVSLNKSRT